MAATASINQDDLTGSGTVDPLFTVAATAKIAISIIFENNTGGVTDLALFINGSTSANQWGGDIEMQDGDKVIWKEIVGSEDVIYASSSSASTPVHWTASILEG